MNQFVREANKSTQTKNTYIYIYIYIYIYVCVCVCVCVDMLISYNRRDEFRIFILDQLLYYLLLVSEIFCSNTSHLLWDATSQEEKKAKFVGIKTLPHKNIL